MVGCKLEFVPSGGGLVAGKSHDASVVEENIDSGCKGANSGSCGMN